MPNAPSRSQATLKFSPQGDFRRTLRTRVDAYFQESGLDSRGYSAMYLKTFTLYAWLLTSYGLLVFAPVPVWVRILAAISLGFASAGIGFSVMHDAGHGAYSKNSRLNQWIFYSLDLLGGSSYMWNHKHNIIHHTYANVAGHDDDIDMGILGRLSPEQPHRAAHRFQHLYVWFLYGLISVKWNFYDDFAVWITGKIGDRTIPRPKGKDAAALILGKLVFYSLAIGIPTALFGFGPTVLFYLLVVSVQGVVLATIFQLAHCVEDASFPVPPENQLMEHDWATHQVLTTVNFAPNNRILSWYVGGLNFQIEHHLFPKICHVHYPALSKIVHQTCSEFALPYNVQPTLFNSIRSHFRFLRAMGRPPLAAAATIIDP